MNVTLLHPCYWPEVRRGSERFARDLADGLIGRGHSVRLVTAHPGPRSVDVEDGLEVVRLRRPPDARLRRRGFPAYTTHVPLAYRELRRETTDVAHALHPTDAMAAARWSQAVARPAVFSFMGIASHPMLTATRSWATTIRRAARGAAATVALSRAAADSLDYWLGVDARVIAPGVDLEAFSPGGERSEAPTIVCAAAAEDERKRVGLLVDALGIVRRSVPEARLVLSRPRDRVVEARFASLDGVELADLDDRAALADAYRSAWASALPSVGEAFGLVLAEALACGTPVVGTRDGALCEIVDADTIGRLFEGGSAEALAEAVLEAFALAGQPGTTAACRARAEEFSADRCADAYAALYAEFA